MTRAIIYAAKSTEDKHGSIPDQLADGRKLAASHGYEIAGEYTDENKSAYSGDRGSGLARALAACEQMGEGVLIVQHSDRLARGDGRQAKHLVEYVLWALKHGITIRSVQDPGMFPEGDLGILLGALGGQRNTEDSRRKSLSVKDGLRRRTENGKPLGGPAPFGYDRVAGELVPCPSEAAIVQRVFHLADPEAEQGAMSQRQIAKLFDSEGVPKPAGQPGLWGQTTVYRILDNPIYKGMIRHGIYEPTKGRKKGRRVGDRLLPGSHPAIVTEDQWNRVNAARALRPSSNGGRAPKGIHLLTNGIFRCKCGAAMMPRTDTAGRQNYRCSARWRNPTACDQKFLPRLLVDEAVLTALQTRHIDVDEQLARISASHEAKLATARETVEQADMEAAKTRNRLSRIARALQDGVIDDEDYQEQRSQLLAERDAADAALERAQAHLDETEGSYGVSEARERYAQKMAEIRAHIVVGIENAPDLSALREKIGWLFDSLRLRVPEEAELAQKSRAEAFTGKSQEAIRFGASGYWIDPVLRREALTTDQDSLESE